ncbi:MAG: ABC-F type ribosomal protection protein [Lachnospiraceae bacterium]
MAQISVNNLTFYYEGSFDNIFENVSFSIDTDWKLGFIGRNGKGKTTFLNLLLGKYSYRGTIDTNTTFDYFPYQITEAMMELPAALFIEEIKAGCEEWRVICELTQLNEGGEILYRPYKTLSFGERTKIMLAVLFSGENNFLLIDEPTNHLDYNTRENVKEYLASKKGFILVSHDRDLLDACTDHVLVLNRQTIQVQKGNFSCWWENKQKKDQFEQAENERHLKEIKKLKQAVARTSQWADKSEATKIGFDPTKEHASRAYIGAKTKKLENRVTQMKNRIQREIEEKEGLLKDLESPVELKLVQLTHHKKTLINVKDYTLKYQDSDKPVFTGLSFSVCQGERIALHGKNGCGKSTLIKMILQKAGLLEVCDGINMSILEEGVCETAAGLTISYVSQDTSYLKGDIQSFCREHSLDFSLFCSILRQLDFERVQFSKNMEDYSEGQKKKVLLASSLMTPAHLYIWDEPLNYIDIFSRMQIENLILKYKPAMLFVEHDLRFVEKIATRVIEL